MLRLCGCGTAWPCDCVIVCLRDCRCDHLAVRPYGFVTVCVSAAIRLRGGGAVCLCGYSAAWRCDCVSVWLVAA